MEVDSKKLEILKAENKVKKINRKRATLFKMNT